MKEFPSIPRAVNAPEDLFERGHLWILEKVDGANVRFQLQESGYLRFGDRSRVYEPDAIPDQYQHAVRHVREHLDREALRNAVDDVESVVFFGEATHHHTIDYDWGRTPSFLGFAVWSARENAFRPPDAVEGIFEKLGLQPVHAVEREVRAQDFDANSYSIPESAYYDGPAEGVVVRNKTGGQAKLLHPDFREVEETVPVDAPAEELADRYATRRRFEKLAAKLESRGEPVTVDTLYERALEDIIREEHKQLYHGDASVDVNGDASVDVKAFRSTVAALTREFLDGR